MPHSEVILDLIWTLALKRRRGLFDVLRNTGKKDTLKEAEIKRNNYKPGDD